MTDTELKSHPATFTPAIADMITLLINHENRPGPVLDPFAGIGTIHTLGRRDTISVELEHEWAIQAHRTRLEHDTLAAYEANSLDIYDMISVRHQPAGIVTSPAYGNRMADQYDGRDGSTRATYATSLGRACSAGSGAALQWGPDYRGFHTRHIEAWRHLLPDNGWLILNMKDHPRDGTIQRVCRWWIQTTLDYGFDLARAEAITTPGMRFGAQGDIDIDHEMLYLFVVDPDYDTSQRRLF
ncbi:MAG: hypothetical protein AAGA90_07870 [Actinomycetota bacterium]